MQRIALVVAFLVMGQVDNLMAQEVLDSVVAKLDSEVVLRLRLETGRIVEGQKGTQEGDLTTLHLKGTAAPILTNTVDSLWVRGTATTEGIVIGGLALGIPCALVAAYLAAESEKTQGEAETGIGGGLALIGGAVIGGGVGALMGAAIGSGIPKWRLRYGRSQVAFDLMPANAGVMVRIAF